MPENSHNSQVIVDGDVTVDWLLADLGPQDGETTDWLGELRTRMCWQRGGAALVFDLVTGVLSDVAGLCFQAPDLPDATVRNDDRRYHHAYTMWRRDGGGVWRVHQFLGVDRGDTRVELDADAPDHSPPRLIVIDDAALGYRDAPLVWPPALREPDGQSWILLKTASPVATGELWQHLLQSCPQRLIVVLTVGDLRRTEVQISRGLSWERTAQDIVWEITNNPTAEGLANCASLVVSFGTAGAILHSAGDSAAKLVFDPQVMEGEWEACEGGQMVGNTATLTAALARQIALSPESPDLIAGLQSGVHATRTLFNRGYRSDGGRRDGLEIGFPLDEIVRAIREPPAPLAVADIPNAYRSIAPAAGQDEGDERPRFWTILEDRCHDGLLPLAERIVLDGLDRSLTDVPVGRIGFLTTVDRSEIESLRSIQSLIREYSRHKQQDPLSIAVFGPPGSGKSFGVEQVARSIDPKSIRPLTFNLSQFDQPSELLQALHQVRDVGLSGQLPLVFWDEFDTPLPGRPLGWLKYFLAPMQDGKFQEGQITHPIGRSIFVFAGGTSATMEEFMTSLDSDLERRAAKLPDFVSRLKGYLNVLGPNPQSAADDGPDPYFIIRRAILLRSLLERQAGQLLKHQDGGSRLQIDTGVLRALLQVSRYKHGIRSMKSIVSMSELAGRRSFQRSSLPSQSQLDLHVDGQEFLSLVHGPHTAVRATTSNQSVGGVGGR